MPRLVYLSGVALIFVAIAFLFTQELLWRRGVTARNVARIREGMTMPEVEALLGGPGQLMDVCGDSRWSQFHYTWGGAGGKAEVFVARSYLKPQAAVIVAVFVPHQSGSLDPLRRAVSP